MGNGVLKKIKTVLPKNKHFKKILKTVFLVLSLPSKKLLGNQKQWRTTEEKKILEQ